MGKEDIAAKLKQARISANKTQKEVADILGMTYQAISNYERGKTKVESDILVKLCQIYGISVPEILLEQPLNEKKFHVVLSDTDKRLQKIINCYNEMDDTGKDGLADQAEYLMEKHPKAIQKNNAISMILKEDINYVNAAHAIEGASEEDRQHDEDIMDADDF